MEKAGELLEAFLRLHNITGGQEYVAFFKSWHGIVGTDIAAHSKVTDIKNGALVVEVDHPGWMQKLHMRKDEVLRKIASQYPQLGVRTLHLRAVSAFSRRGISGGDGPRERHEAPHDRTTERVSSENGSSEKASPSSESSHESPEASKNAKEALDRIEDDKLKSTLSRLYGDLKHKNAD